MITPANKSLNRRGGEDPATQQVFCRRAVSLIVLLPLKAGRGLRQRVVEAKEHEADE